MWSSHYFTGFTFSLFSILLGPILCLLIYRYHASIGKKHNDQFGSNLPRLIPYLLDYVGNCVDPIPFLLPCYDSSNCMTLHKLWVAIPIYISVWNITILFFVFLACIEKFITSWSFYRYIICEYASYRLSNNCFKDEPKLFNLTHEKQKLA